MASQFTEAYSLNHELPRPEIERQHLVANIFDRDKVRIGNLPALPQAGFRLEPSQM